MKCPFNCEKVNNLTAKIANLVSDGKQLSKDHLLLQQITESICKIAEEGHQLLWVGKYNGRHYAIFIYEFRKDAYDSSRLVYLHSLPYQNAGNWKALISLKYKGCCQVYIEETAARPQGCGYGSLLMAHTLSYLCSAGFRTITGIISKSDFKRREELHKFYHDMFHFEITPGTESDKLYLDLFNEKTPLLEKGGVIACCRDDRYPFLKDEAHLAHFDRMC